MIASNQARQAAALLLLCGCCRTPGAGPAEPQAAAAARQQPEAISLLGRPLTARPPGPQRRKLEADLAAARRALRADPGDPDRIVWVGRRLGYLWRMREAVEVYSAGIARHPDHAPLYRHRGHRYISLRRFDRAIKDLERAAGLIAGQPDRVEPDGMPNALNIPLTTTAFNVYYHLGLARYLAGDLRGALAAYRQALTATRGYEDNRVAVLHWMVLTLWRLGRDAEASALLAGVPRDLHLIENHAYHKLLLLYKGLRSPEDLLHSATGLDLATLGYGTGCWYLHRQNTGRARQVFQRIVAGAPWPAFGFIAAEVELAGAPVAAAPATLR